MEKVYNRAHTGVGEEVVAYLNRCATCCERHAGHDVSAVGGEAAGIVSQLEEIHINIWHGGFLQGHHHHVGFAVDLGLAY